MRLPRVRCAISPRPASNPDNRRTRYNSLPIAALGRYSRGFSTRRTEGFEKTPGRPAIQGRFSPPPTQDPRGRSHRLEKFGLSAASIDSVPKKEDSHLRDGIDPRRSPDRWSHTHHLPGSSHTGSKSSSEAFTRHSTTRDRRISEGPSFGYCKMSWLSIPAALRKSLDSKHSRAAW